MGTWVVCVMWEFVVSGCVVWACDVGVWACVVVGAWVGCLCMVWICV